MKPIPPLYILRHGETTWNASGRLQGHHHADLTERGRAQARAQHAILKARDLDGFAALTSPQGRAVETARIVLDGLIGEVHHDDALREIGLGDWAGQDRDTLIAQSGARDGFDVYEHAPGGEGFAALRVRCEAFIAALRGPSVLVTHGITSRMLRLVLTHRPLADLRDIEGGQGVVFYLQNGVQERLVSEA